MAQVNRYFVSFRDKSNSPYSISAPQQFLSQKSIDRRSREKFLTNEEDLPVNKTYVQQVKNTGAKVYFSSRWFNGVLVQTDGAIASAIAGLSCVSKVELVGYGPRLSGRMSASQKFGQVQQGAGLQNQLQLAMIGLDQMHADGIHGEGVDVAVFDSGFNGIDTLSSFKSMFQEGRVRDAFNFVGNSTNVYAGYQHGTWVFSIIAGNISGTYLGGAYKANFFLYQTEDAFSEYRIEEYNWLFAAERADSLGVDVINSSLGYSTFDDPAMDYTYKDVDGKTSVISRAAQKAIDRGIVVVNSAGNEGNTSWRYLTPPADVNGVIAVGSVEPALNHSSFSSVGPSADGRIKPDVSALGDYSVMISPAGGIQMGGGTSFSSPAVASLAAGLKQVFPQASAKEIYTRIINSATRSANPDNELGYGIPNYSIAKNLTEFTEEFEIYPNPATGLLKVIFKNPDGQEFKTTLYTCLGQQLIEQTSTATWGNNPSPIDISSLAPGVYLLRVETHSFTKTQRIVKIN
ncbi:peptidase S8 [Cytophagales bacterium WSM2-2]|nr:peptidase S8 [Cytophagales bacterium WSM2-2]